MVLLLVSCVVGVGLVRLVTCGAVFWLAATVGWRHTLYFVGFTGCVVVASVV